MKNLVQTGTSFLKEFQKFAVKGNVMDMAIGVVIGTAFGKIVSSLVADIIMPLVGLFVGNIDLKDLSITLVEKEGENPGIVLTYGAFLQTIFDFVIIAFAIFITLKILLNLKQKLIKEQEEAPAAPAPDAPDVALLKEIRDLLKEKNS